MSARETLSAGLEGLTEFGPGLAAGLSLLLLIGACATAISRAPIHRQHFAVWTLGASWVLVALLVAPLPRPAQAWLSGQLNPAEPAPAARGALAPPAALPTPLTPVRDGGAPPSAEGPIVREHPRSPAAPSPSTAITPSLASALSTSAGGWSWSRWLTATFLIGALLLVLRVLVGGVLLRRTLRRARPASSHVQARVHALAGSRPPRVLIDARTAGPFCCGLGRGAIVLPAALEDPAQALRLEAVLRHELAHLGHGHPRMRALAASCAPLLFWNPLYWWLARDLRTSAELLADGAAVEGFDKRCYVEELLALAESLPPHRTLRAAGPGVLGSRAEFLARMETLIMRNDSLCSTSTARHAIGRALGAALLLGSMSVAWGRPAQDGQSLGADMEQPTSTTPTTSLALTGASIHTIDSGGGSGMVGKLRLKGEIHDAHQLGEFLFAAADHGYDVTSLSLYGQADRSGVRMLDLTLEGREDAGPLPMSALRPMLQASGLSSVGSPPTSPFSASGAGARNPNTQPDDLASGAGLPGGGAGSPGSGMGLGAYPPGSLGTGGGLEPGMGGGAGASHTSGGPNQQDELLRLRQQVRELQSQQQRMLLRIDALLDDTPASAANGKPQIGTVASIQEAGGRQLLFASFRAPHGLQVGEEVHVYSGSTYKGTATVEIINETDVTLAVTSQVEGKTIVAGDRVTNQL